MAQIFLKKEAIIMEIRFYLVQITGEKVSDMTNYDAGIFDILAHVTDEHDEVILGDDWFSLSRVPTLEEILIINRNLAKLGLVIDA
jgi:hypothetical protein